MLLLFLVACQAPQPIDNYVSTSDIDHFWEAYDRAILTEDSVQQVAIIDSLYIERGTAGLREIMRVRNYTAGEYVSLIRRYPKFWNSIRANTLRAKSLADELNTGIAKLAAIYPDLQPAHIYFTIGCMRTNGTTRDSLVLIGSELAMADSTADISAFEAPTRQWLGDYFKGNSIDNLVLLNIHEYVHTQQAPMPTTLLYQVVYEGVAEFVSVTALEQPSSTPAVAFGQQTPAVRALFEEEMFFERTQEWMWSNAPNDFGVRDLGYYIGYAIAEKHYQQADDKLQAIRELIELDFTDEVAMEAFIDDTGYFSAPIAALRAQSDKRRPSVRGIAELENGATDVDPSLRVLTFEFTEALNGYNTGVDYAELGAAAFPVVTAREWASDGQRWTMRVELEPRTRYQFWITQNFRTEEGIPLRPFLVDFTTGE